MVLSFVGGVSHPLLVVSLLFSVSYPQDRRSYYLFFNYLFFNYLFFNYLCVYPNGRIRAGECYPNGRIRLG